MSKGGLPFIMFNPTRNLHATTWGKIITSTPTFLRWFYAENEIGLFYFKSNKTCGNVSLRFYFTQFNGGEDSWA